MGQSKPVERPFNGQEVLVLVGNQVEPSGDQGRTILYTVMPDVIRSFLKKNRDYGDTSFELGLKGQYAELHRKMGKLKRSMWEGEALAFEQTDEVLSDLIGHCLLSMYFLKVESLGKDKVDEETFIANVTAGEEIIAMSKYLAFVEAEGNGN